MNRKLTAARRWLLLGAGGFVHGLFQTGGPLIVYVTGRELEDKSEFRSTVSMLFMPLSIALLINYWWNGLYQQKVVRLMLWAIVPVLLGLVIGEWVHHKVDNRRFKRAVWWLLAGGGSVLSLRAGAHFFLE